MALIPPAPLIPPAAPPPPTARSRTPEDPRLAALLMSTATGDEAAFGELYALTRGRVQATACRVLRSSDHADEVTQETFAQVWRYAGRYDPAQGSVLAWVSMIARRRAVDHVRALVREAALQERHGLVNAVAIAPDSYEELLSRLDAVRVRQAMTDLSAIQHEALCLRYVHSRSLKEIAEELRVPLGTVKTRIRDGLARLRRAVEAETGSQPLTG